VVPRLGSKREGSLILLSLPVLSKLVSGSVDSELAHPVVILVAYWDHTPSGELTTHMGTRASGVPMPIVCAINTIPRVGVLIAAFVCPFESFDGLMNEGELDQASTHVIKQGCLVQGSSG